MKARNLFNTAWGLAALLSVASFAEERFLPPPQAEQPLPQAPMDRIFKVGTSDAVPNAFNLVDGTYIVGEITGDTIKGKHYLMVEGDVNDEDMFYALLIPKHLVESDGGTGIAHFYQGRRIRGSSSLMLSPVNIDLSGNLQIGSESQRSAPVLEILQRPGRSRYPYIIKGRNGALGGQILGMRGMEWVRPVLRSRPNGGVFVAGWEGQPQMVVNFPSVSFYEGSAGDSNYSALDMNGDSSKFSVLTKSSLDTIAEANLSDEAVSRIAIFAKGGCFDNQVMMVLVPRAEQGQYNITIYRPAPRSVWERIFPGRKTPWVGNAK